jgi:hypothetical protein
VNYDDYIRDQLPQLKKDGHDTSEIEELLDTSPQAKTPPEVTDRLDYDKLVAFFYEEPERMQHLTERVLKAEVPIETMKEVLSEEGCWGEEEDMALVTAEILRSPPVY